MAVFAVLLVVLGLALLGLWGLARERVRLVDEVLEAAEACVNQGETVGEEDARRLVHLVARVMFGTDRPIARYLAAAADKADRTELGWVLVACYLGASARAAPRLRRVGKLVGAPLHALRLGKEPLETLHGLGFAPPVE